MQHIRYEACEDENAVQQELDRMVGQELLTPEQRAMVNCRQIANFFQTELGKKLQCSKNVLREFKFSILDDGRNYDESLIEEKILLQGVVDCALIEPDGITVVDFKTDSVTEATMEAAVQRYRPQVMAYVDALERIFQRKVKQALLYFFRLNTFASLDR